MAEVMALISAGGQGAQAGQRASAPLSPQVATPQNPVAPGAPGQPGNSFGARMQPAETKDSFAGEPKRYARSGFSAGIDTAARIGNAMQHPGQFLVERMAGDPAEAGTFAQQHPEMMGIVKGLFD